MQCNHKTCCVFLKKHFLFSAIIISLTAAYMWNNPQLIFKTFLSRFVSQRFGKWGDHNLEWYERGEFKYLSIDVYADLHNKDVSVCSLKYFKSTSEVSVEFSQDDQWSFVTWMSHSHVFFPCRYFQRILGMRQFHTKRKTKKNNVI